MVILLQKVVEIATCVPYVVFMGIGPRGLRLASRPD